MILPEHSFDVLADVYRPFFNDTIIQKQDRKLVISQDGINLIKSFEGFSRYPYRDPAGYPTIGYGFRFYPNGKMVKITDRPLNKEEAEKMLDILLDKYESAVNKAVTTSITQHQFDALVSFTYNVGIGALNRSTLLKMINENPNNPNIKAEIERWRYSAGKSILLDRRKQEAKLYFK